MAFLLSTFYDCLLTLSAIRSYLLGSAGTLMFDVTIVLQAYVYRTKRTRYTLVPEQIEAIDAEEQEGLISAGALESGAAHPRRRLPTSDD